MFWRTRFRCSCKKLNTETNQMLSLRFCMTSRRGCLQLYPITVNKHFSLFNHARILSAPLPPQSRPQPPMMIPHRSFSSLRHRSQQHEREREQCDNDQGNKLPTTTTTKVSSKGSWLRYTIDEQSHNKTIKEILTDHMLVSGKTIQKATRINGLFVDNRRPFLQHRGKLGQTIRILISKSLSSPSSPMTPSSSTVPNISPAGHGNKQDSKKQLNDENDENAEGNLENRHHKQRASQFVKILYEDEHLLVVNKPPGVLMYPSTSTPDRMSFDIAHSPRGYISHGWHSRCLLLHVAGVGSRWCWIDDSEYRGGSARRTLFICFWGLRWFGVVSIFEHSQNNRWSNYNNRIKSVVSQTKIIT